MRLEDFTPRSSLVTQKTEILSPRFPVIDAHNHLGDEFGGGWIRRPLSELVAALDMADVRLYVDLDGGWGKNVFLEHLRILEPLIPQRVRLFSGVEWSAWDSDDFGEEAAAALRRDAARGSSGLKVWKNLGLHVRDQRADLVRVNDARLDPLWATAGELGLPVLIHTADPRAFFEPLDENNERWEELHAHPDWQFPSPPFPPFLSLVNDLLETVLRHPRTTFIAAHVGCYAEDLDWVSRALERAPNLYVDISARIAELGRQPYASRRFFLRHARRILFGLDLGPDLTAYRINYRFLETDDEYFPYSADIVPPQGRWNIYGLGLPDDVLKMVYHGNAQRIFSCTI